MTDHAPLTKLEKLEVMHRLFGKDEKHQCKDCCHRIVHEYSKKYAKCEVFSTSHSVTTDWGSLQCACGLWNKETDKRNVFISESGLYRKQKQKVELQPETLF